MAWDIYRPTPSSYFDNLGRMITVTLPDFFPQRTLNLNGDLCTSGTPASGPAKRARFL